MKKAQSYLIVRFRVLLLLTVFVGIMAGCGTFDTNNASSRPWNRPTKADLSQDWWNRPSGHTTDYP